MNYYTLDDVCQVLPVPHVEHCRKPKGVDCQPVCGKKGEDVHFTMYVRSKCNVSW